MASVDDQDQYYAQALTELRDKNLHEATFARAFADGLGDAEKTKALYVKYRAASLIKGKADDDYRKREFHRILSQAESSGSKADFSSARPDQIAVPEANRKTAAILAILFGWLGAHKIYMGKMWPAIITGGIFFLGLVMAAVPSFAIVFLSIYEAVCYFNMTDEEFHRKYIVGQESWF
jgi:TM2 domain-containing membrane protein YozV